MIIRFTITGTAAAHFDGAPEAERERLAAKVREILEGGEVHVTIDDIYFVLTLEIDPHAAD